MNGEEERSDEETPPDDEEVAEGDAPGGAEVVEAPPFTIGGNEGLGNQWMMVGDQEVAETFGSSTFEGIRQGQTRWAARFTGEGFDGPSADPLKTAALLRRVAMTARWIANGLFPGHRQVPGFVVVQAARSIVLQFAIARDEEPLRIREPVAPAAEADEQAEDAGETEARTIYPTVEGGRYFATLLVSHDRPEQLVERLQPIGKQAVRQYQNALKEFVDYGASMDLVVPSVEPDGRPVLRAVHNPPESSEAGLVVLNRAPETVTQRREIEGLLYVQNSLKNEFGIQRDNGQHVTGEYDIGVADKLGPAWDKRVWAKIEEIGPKEDWMPRAGRLRRRLIDVVVLHEGETRLSN